MMSKKSKTKTAPSKEIDWVEPSFIDFCQTTQISSVIFHKKLSTNIDDYHKSKEHFPPLENYKSGSKKRKPFSVDEKYKLFKQDHSQTEPWIDKYKPKTQGELAIHKKKIEEVEGWLKDRIFQNQPREGGSILLLTGPPGCGKSATVEILAKDLGVQIQEWINPVLLDFKKDDFHVALIHESDFQMLPYQSQTVLFQEFLLRANKYIKLQMVGESTETNKRLILVEDIPNHFYHDPSSLHDILRRFLRTGRCPLVFIISDAFSGGSSQRSLFPKEILEELPIVNISFNPVAPTMMLKVLNRITAGEHSMRGEKFVVPDKAILELICKGCSGDIRSAINTLQFSSLKDCSSENSLWLQRKKKSKLKCDTLPKIKKKTLLSNFLENQEVAAIGSKDASIFIFHALGKILYCKREPATEMDVAQLPCHLSEYERNSLLVQPEDVIEKSHMPGELFNLYLHQNYLEFFSDIDDVVRASEYFSTADFLCNKWQAQPTGRDYSASIATRGVMHSNRAQSKGGLGFRPLHKPLWFSINKKYRENCFAAKSLFSSFCSTPLCLQTELLPYFAMLTNPMRNQAQITFIQDVGRLPLRKHFGRLKLESLTDKDSAIQVLDSDDDGESAETQPTDLFIQGEKVKASEENELAELLLPSSQSSGTELPASQPQPCPVVTAMILKFLASSRLLLPIATYILIYIFPSTRLPTGLFFTDENPFRHTYSKRSLGEF